MYIRVGISGGSDSPLTIVITTETSELYGQTITISKSGSTVGTTTFDNTGHAEYEVSEAGTYTVSVTYDGRTFTDTVVVDNEFESLVNYVPDGSTVTPVNDIQTWLHCANIWDKNYTTLDEVLADSTTLLALISDHNSVDYLVRSTAWAANPGLVPIMTSNTQPSGTAFANNGTNPWKAFDGSDTTYAESGSNAFPYMLGYTFTSAVCVKKVYIKPYFNASVYIKDFKIQGSNDGFTSDINDLYSGSFESTELEKTITLENADSYTSYRINAANTQTGKTYVTIYTVQFYAYTYANGITEDSSAMTMIGANDYAADTLLADSTWFAAICRSTYFESVLNVKVPTMTSNTAPSGECFATHGNASAYMAFNGNLTDYWTGGTYPSSVGYDFTEPILIAICHIIKNGSGRMATYKIQGSNTGDSDDWDDLTDVLSISTSGNNEKIDYITPSTKYRYVRLCGLTGVNNYAPVIYEMQFYGR